MRRWDLQFESQVEAIIESKTSEDVHRHGCDLFRRNRLNIHPTFSAEHDDGGTNLPRGINDDTYIIFLVDVQFLLYQYLFHLQFFDFRSEDLVRNDLGIDRVFGEFNASCLSSTPCPDL